MAFTLHQVELAEKTLAFIQGHQNLHEQGEWLSIDIDSDPMTFDKAIECGTPGCFAGWAALINGAELSYDPISCVIQTADGELVEDYAARALGIEPYLKDYQDHMFDSKNDLEDLADYVGLMRRSYEAQLVA